MDKLEERLYSISEADKYAFFEKVFKEKKIALVDGRCVAQIKPCGVFWLKRYLFPYFSNLDCSIYKIDHYAIVWKGYSNVPIFIADIDCPFDILPTDGYDFFLCKNKDGQSCFEHYIWQPSTQQYLVKQLDHAPSPDAYKHIKHSTHREHSWDRIWPHDDVEIASTDNKIFYGFIARFAQ